MKQQLSEFRSLSIQELESKIVDLEEEQMRLRCNHTIQGLENTNLLMNGRKKIARAKTVLTEKRLSQ